MGAIRTIHEGVQSLNDDPFVQSYALDTADTDRQVEVSGENIAILACPAAAALKVKLNRTSNTGIPMFEGDAIEQARFARVFLTWTAVAGGTLTLLISNEAKFKAS